MHIEGYQNSFKNPLVAQVRKTYFQKGFMSCSSNTYSIYNAFKKKQYTSLIVEHQMLLNKVEYGRDVCSW